MGCTNDNQNETAEVFKTKPLVVGAFTENVDMVVRDSHTCKIEMDKIEINDSTLIGEWVDSLVWIHENECWVALEYTNKEIFVKFQSNGKFEWRENWPSKKNKVNLAGKFSISTSNDSCFLELLNNSSRDTIFSEGDTVLVSKYLIHSVQPNLIRLQSFNYNSNKFDNDIEQLRLKK
jgi:hypothetical protein